MLDVGRLDPDDTRPPYRQVAEALKEAVQKSVFKPGDKLPSHAVISEDYGVSVGTVKRALGLLQTEGILITRQGQGAYVRTQPSEVGTSDASAAAFRAELASLTERVSEIERRLPSE